MKRRSFFKSLGLMSLVAVIAPKLVIPYLRPGFAILKFPGQEMIIPNPLTKFVKIPIHLALKPLPMNTEDDITLINKMNDKIGEIEFIRTDEIENDMVVFHTHSIKNKIEYQPIVSVDQISITSTLN